MKEYRRILWLSFSVFLLFGLLVVQFFRVQILQNDKWSAFARSQHELIIKEPFKRGLFYANTSIHPFLKNQKRPFVIDIPKAHLFADPKQIPLSKHLEIAQKLQEILKLPTESFERYLKELAHNKSRSRKMQMWISLKDQEKILEWWYPFAKKNKLPSNALFFIADYKRSYPYGTLLGQLLHTIQENKEEITKQGLPTGGLEYYFNSYLKGSEGKKKLLRSPRHALDQGKIIEKPTHGSDVYLTINHHLQAIVEEEIEKGVKECGAKSGWAVMMDPYTGEIWAMAQYPHFDPEKYKEYYLDEEKIEQTRLKGICDSYEPGSMFKAITIAILFLANEELKKSGEPPVFDPLEKVSTKSGHFKGRTKPLTDPRLYKYTNAYLALQRTTNIYLAKLVERVIDKLGAQWYRDQLSEIFHFGQKTGIEYPLEAPGFLPRLGVQNSNGSLEWSVPTPYSLAIGYNLMVNSLQMCCAYASFCNGGFWVKPSFVQRITHKNEEGREEVLYNPSDLRKRGEFKRIIPENVAREVMRSLYYTISYNGHVNQANVYGYTVAGKSGTARKIVKGKYSTENYFSSFIGFAPARSPKFVLLVSMDEPQKKLKHGVGYLYYGGKCSAPVFREISRRSLKYLGVAPDNPFHYPFGDPRRDVSKTFWYQENQALNKIYQDWNES